ncbi:MAG: hypothetical protein LBL74_07600 [Bacteroidales bacterium]|jgi:hypothetical protein|nr:hypothetical protein [Bacteroidales bacterium]
MKKHDIIFIVSAIVIVLAFFCITPLNDWFSEWSKAKDGRYFVLAFLKFGVLATAGECIGLRIAKGKYNEKGFGVMPRFIVWGILGVGISTAMSVFAGGTFGFLHYCGLDLNPADIANECFGNQLIYAFSVSVLMNTFFAPVFMTVHKITDTHILEHQGTIRGFFKPIAFGRILKNLNWDVQWNFVFKKTIPFFWYPAHTITFMLPSEYRVLFAALLGVALGLILSIANLKKSKS